MQTVLIIDDSRAFQKAIQNILSQHFQVVGVAKSGEEGIELFQKCNPQLVLLDITMPNLSGKECLQRLMEINRDALVIMISGVGDSQTIQDCIDLGAQAYVCKKDISQQDSEDSILVQTLKSVLTQKNLDKEAA